MPSDLTVMGPGVMDTPGDMFEYTRAKGTAQNLGHAILTRMDQQYKRIITSAIDSGVRRLRTHADGSKFSDKEQVNCVEQTLDLVAKETTTDRVKRLIRMTKEVYECKRAAKESFAEYSTRFETLARAYLSAARTQLDSQDEQNFAIMAIENAGLPISTYNAIITNLVTHAKDNVRPQRVQIETNIMQKLGEATSQREKAITDALQRSDELQPGSVTVHGLLKHMGEAKSITVRIPLPTTSNGSQEYAISLARAVEELRDVRTEDQRQIENANGAAGTPNTPVKVEALQQPTKQIGAMMSGREDHKEQSNNRNGKRNLNKGRRGGRRSGGSWRGHKSRRSRRRDRTDTEDDRSSDEEEEEHRKRSRDRGTRRNVFDRLGSKKDEEERSQKRVKFDDHNKEKNDSDSDSYFRSSGRQWS